MYTQLTFVSMFNVREVFWVFMQKFGDIVWPEMCHRNLTPIYVN